MQLRNRVLLAALGCLFLATTTLATAALAEDNGGDALLGRWWFPERNGKFEVRREQGVYYGKVVAYEDPDALDKNNPDPKLRTRRFVGIDMLKDFSYDGDHEWSGGTIYDGNSGKTYKCSLWFDDGDTSRLNGRGYVGISLFGRTEVFARVTKEEEEAERAKEEAAQKEREKEKARK